MKVDKIKNLKVFGSIVKVEVVDLGDSYGGLCHGDSLIQINSRIKSEPERIRILIHELLHAVSYRVSLDQSISYEVEQIIVDTFSKALCENFDIKLKKK